MASELDKLSEAATQGVWEELGAPGCVYAHTNTIQQSNPHNSPLACALVNAYRSGQLVPSSAIEEARREERERCAAAVEADFQRFTDAATNEHMYPNSCHYTGRAVQCRVAAETIRALPDPQDPKEAER